MTAVIPATDDTEATETSLVDLGADHHIHSTFSDGTGTLDENLRAGIRAGLHTLGFVDHARSNTEWLGHYVAAVRELASGTPITLTCGIEVKILDTTGSLDLPPDAHRVDRFVIADHQVPLDAGPRHPAAVRSEIERGERDPSDVVDALLEATASAAHRHPGSTLAHLFSVLPKCGIEESAVRTQQLDTLATALVAADTSVELSERWRCPGPRAIAVFRGRGVNLIASTDSHRSETIGRYRWVPTAIKDSLLLDPGR